MVGVDLFGSLSGPLGLASWQSMEWEGAAGVRLEFPAAPFLNYCCSLLDSPDGVPFARVCDRQRILFEEYSDELCLVGLASQDSRNRPFLVCYHDILLLCCHCPYQLVVTSRLGQETIPLDAPSGMCCSVDFFYKYRFLF